MFFVLERGRSARKKNERSGRGARASIHAFIGIEKVSVAVDSSFAVSPFSALFVFFAVKVFASRRAAGGGDLEKPGGSG
jgi:hypothetical protein